MRKIILAASALLALPFPAFAADLPIPAPVATVPSPTFSWEGPYIGVGAGGAVGTETDNLSVTTQEVPVGDTFGLSGFAAGIYAGENWDLDQVVVGLEGDIGYANLTGNHDFAYGGIYTGNLSLSTQWQAFVRGRVGLPVDRALFYVTGGVGAAQASLTAATDPSDLSTTGGSSSNVHFGGTIGVGAEYAFTDNLIGRAEIDYSKFADQTYSLGDFGSVSAGWDQTTATLGLAYKF